MKRAGVKPQVAVDWTKCFGYEKLVSEEIEHYSSIEVTEGLKEGGLAANRAWEDWYRFLAANWQTHFVNEIVEAARHFEAPRLLSLGCGYGGMEIDCARRLSEPYEILALDVNENLFRRGREEVTRDGLHVDFQALDLNFVELEQNAFDVVFAHASLHHLLNFENLFAQVYRALKDDGRLILLDIIGKTQVLFWPENVRFATDQVARMPRRYRGDLVADERILFPGYLDGAEQQGMEGIRQEELEEQVGLCFRSLKMFKYNSFVRLICMHPEIAPRLDPDRAEDRAYLNSLYRLDLEQIAKGALRATEMFAVYEKKPQGEGVSGELGSWPRPRANPKVSVCIACDGSAEELRRCFASVLAQTHRNLEVLLVLGAEDDEAAKLARELAAGHPGVRLVSSAAAGGGPASWSQGLPSVTGEYVANLSSRDAWYPIKLSTQLAFLEEHPELGLVFAQAIVVDDRGRRTARAFGTDVVGEDISKEALERLIEGHEIPRSTALFRRTFWQQIQLSAADVMTEEDVWLRLTTRWQVGFQGRTLSMLRVPVEAACEDRGEDRQRHLAALERLRRDATRLGPRLAELQIQAALDRRIAALGGTACGDQPARPQLLRRIARLLAGKRA